MSGWGNPADLPGYNAPGEEWYASALADGGPLPPKPPSSRPPVGTIIFFIVGVMLISAVFAIF